MSGQKRCQDAVVFLQYGGDTHPDTAGSPVFSVMELVLALLAAKALVSSTIEYSPAFQTGIHLKRLVNALVLFHIINVFQSTNMRTIFMRHSEKYLIRT